MGGFETIPLGSNNISEFTGCLKGNRLYQEKYPVIDNSTELAIDACDVATFECEDEPIEGTKRYLEEFIGNVTW